MRRWDVSVSAVLVAALGRCVVTPDEAIASHRVAVIRGGRPREMSAIKLIDPDEGGGGGTHSSRDETPTCEM